MQSGLEVANNSGAKVEIMLPYPVRAPLIGTIPD